MTETATFGACDTCGKPATQAARDITGAPNYDEGVMEYRPHGFVKRGCEEHPVQSEEHRQERPFNDPTWPL
jgi:hypothetical protein